MTAALFPTDDTTLSLLMDSIVIQEDSEHTSLFDLLDILSDMHYGVAEDDDGYPVRWTPHDVIEALVIEVRRLRELYCRVRAEKG